MARLKLFSRADKKAMKQLREDTWPGPVKTPPPVAPEKKEPAIDGSVIDLDIETIIINYLLQNGRDLPIIYLTLNEAIKASDFYGEILLHKHTATLSVNKQPEKEVDNDLLKKALDYLHSNITASIVYEDFHDFSKGIKGAEVDYFPETVAELLTEMGVSQTKSTHVPIEDYFQMKQAAQKLAGIILNIRHETDYMPDSYYEWMDNVLNETDELTADDEPIN